MVTQPAYLEAFKSYTRVQYGDAIQQEEVVADLTAESDRGAIILAATGLEDMLEAAIGIRMKPLETDASARKGMFGPQGICSTFADKILMAYALGIIDKSVRTKIDLVREIRNGCAHGRLPLSFERKELSDICKVVIGDDFLGKLRNQEPRTIRNAFIIAVTTLSSSVVEGQLVTPEEAYRKAMAAMLMEKPKPNA